MRGVYCDGSSIRLRRDLPEPVPSDGETLLSVRVVGVCDTDLQLARGYMGFRGVLGHEFVGETDVGIRVAAEINNSCGSCPTCRAGLNTHCPNRTVLGILGHDGAMADRVCVPRVNVHVIPDHVGDHAAVFIEPLAAAFRITEQLALDASVAMAILGDGKLGQLCTWVAQLTGARVTLIGKHLAKLALAGTGVSIATLEESQALARHFDVVADCTGSTTGLATALRLVRPCGTIVLKTTVAGNHAADLSPIVINEVRVIGSRCGPFPKAIAALESGAIDVRPLIGAVFSLDRAEEAFESAAAKGARKVLLEVEAG
jgi:threonine dehydrogenase-like Zn-dependent dehydrogenase